MKMRIRVISIMTIILGLLSAIALTGCSSGEEQETEIAEVRTPVSTSNPVEGRITKYYQTTGTVFAEEESFLGFPDGGRIVKMNVNRGDHVNVADILAEVDARSHRESVNMARASHSAALDSVSAQQSILDVSRNQLKDARIRFKKVDADHDRYVELFEDEVVTKKELEDMETAWQSAKLAVESAADGVRAGELQVAIAEDQVEVAAASVDQQLKALADTVLKAPFSGLISEILLDIGANPGSGESVLRLTSDGTRKLVLSIPEEYYSLVDLGDVVEVKVSHLGGDTIPLEVAVITDDVIVASRTFYVELQLPEEIEALSGAFCSANMILERIEDAMLIPAAAVLSFEDERGVYVNEDGIAKKVIVEIGIEEGEVVQILSGLDWDDKVVVVGNRFLNEGAKLEETSPSEDALEPESKVEETTVEETS